MLIGSRLILMLFQFHKGTIKTKDRFSLLAAFIDFNSIKVQLKLKFKLIAIVINLFQFHKGTIKTWNQQNQDRH